MNIGIETCLVMAARYAHTRQTGAAHAVVNTVLNLWWQLSDQTKEQLIREAKNEAVYCLEDWQRLINKENTY